MKKLRTHAQASVWLSQQGISVAQWSRDHGFDANLVREILATNRKCSFGISHNIAVALGIKEGVATSKPGRVLRSDRAAGVAA